MHCLCHRKTNISSLAKGGNKFYRIICFVLEVKALHCHFFTLHTHPFKFQKHLPNPNKEISYFLSKDYPFKIIIMNYETPTKLNSKVKQSFIKSHN